MTNLATENRRLKRQVDELTRKAAAALREHNRIVAEHKALKASVREFALEINPALAEAGMAMIPTDF